MQVHLLGTGSADRWPNPFCSCARCAWARTTGVHRDRTSVLIDGELLIDPGPDVGARGADLTAVRTVLVTHGHPDHLDPAFLLAWTWADGSGPLTVAGPPEALDECRPWVGPQSPVRFVPLTVGDVLEAGALRIRAHAAAHSTGGGADHDGTALLYEVAGDARLLYATDTASLPHGELDGTYDVVLLDLTFGDVTDHGTAHLDLPGFGREVARLRGDGRLGPGSRVVAVHLSHHNPPDVGSRLAAIGAEALPDGCVLSVGTGPEHPNRRLLVTGGARSGKSARAEALVDGRAVTYVATAPSYPDDPEWVARVAAHRQRRPAGWAVLETGDVVGILRDAPAGRTVLVDCLTLWLTGVVDAAGAWADPARAESTVADALSGLVDALHRTAADVVLVTNEVGAGIAPETASGRLFRDLLGRVNAGVAGACDDVELVTCGIPQVLKGATWTTST